MIDSDSSQIDNIKCGPSWKLYSLDAFSFSNQGSSSSFAKGMSVFDDLKNSFTDKLRKSIERCDRIHAIHLNYATGGGASSGIGTKILEFLSE